jgi:hypothetical protein
MRLIRRPRYPCLNSLNFPAGKFAHDVYSARRPGLWADDRAGRRIKSRRFSRDQALYVTADLWKKDYTPFNFIKFLDYRAKLILLKKVGGGYIFIHRMLLDYFAEPGPEKRPDETAKIT